MLAQHLKDYEVQICSYLENVTQNSRNFLNIFIGSKSNFLLTVHDFRNALLPNSFVSA
jgi:hypothetical protein